ncbi:MAG TPA: c-type cytochrome [Acidobacteriaceae bacterium]|nr:c-type cytochrome [Acidobacteriaceae bacterium]
MRSPRAGTAIACAVISGAFICAALAGCGHSQNNSLTDVGNPQHGKQLLSSYGCVACHTIPGIRTARGLVGPPLYFYGDRTMIAGQLPNTPANLMRWIEHPEDVDPKTAMPDLGVSQQQAGDMAAYLYTLRGHRKELR